jgi:hypothetical protein
VRGGSLLSVYYSAGQSDLKRVVKAVKNDASGRGQCKRPFSNLGGGKRGS